MIGMKNKPFNPWLVTIYFVSLRQNRNGKRSTQFQEKISIHVANDNTWPCNCIVLEYCGKTLTSFAK